MFARVAARRWRCPGNGQAQHQQALRRSDDQPRRSARCIILAFGKLGGKELNYSSDIDLMFVYDEEARPRPAHHGHLERRLLARVCSEVVRLLSAHTDAARRIASICGCARGTSRPPGTLACQHAVLLRHDGRTWERQASSRCARSPASQLGEEFLRAIEPFVYRMLSQRGRDQRDQGAQSKIEMNWASSAKAKPK